MKPLTPANILCLMTGCGGFCGRLGLTPMGRLYPLPVRQASALPTASSRPHLAVGAVAV